MATLIVYVSDIVVTRDDLTERQLPKERLVI